MSTFTWTNARGWGSGPCCSARAGGIREPACGGGHCGAGDCKKLGGGGCACACNGCKRAAIGEVMPVKRRAARWWAVVRDGRDRLQKARRYGAGGPKSGPRPRRLQ